MEAIRCEQASRVVHDRTSLVTGLHRHDRHELIRVTGGRYLGRADGRPVALGAGECILVPAGCEHGCMEQKVGKLTFLLLQWTGPVGPARAVTFTDHGGRVGHPLSRLVAIAVAPGPAAASLRDHLAAVVVQEALWLVDPAAAPPPAEDPADRVREHLDRNYGASLDLDHLATIAGTSRSTLTRRFRERYGSSPIRYLRELRLRHARRLVETTALPMAAVAERVGFHDPAHLGRLLKRATGRTVHGLRRGGLQVGRDLDV